MDQAALDHNDSLLEHMLRRSDALHERLDELLCDAEFNGTARGESALGMCLVAMEHATALRALMALGMPTSAVSLMRLQFEALTCASRAISEASNEEMDCCDMIVLRLLGRNCPEPWSARRSASSHGS